MIVLPLSYVKIQLSIRPMLTRLLQLKKTREDEKMLSNLKQNIEK